MPQQLLCQFKAHLAERPMEVCLIGLQALAEGSFVDTEQARYFLR